jgi:hypothetical protein
MAKVYGIQGYVRKVVVPGQADFRVKAQKADVEGTCVGKGGSR